MTDWQVGLAIAGGILLGIACVAIVLAMAAWDQREFDRAIEKAVKHGETRARLREKRD
jgi:prolipoprotein diacylglyceryltransferase